MLPTGDRNWQLILPHWTWIGCQHSFEIKNNCRVRLIKLLKGPENTIADRVVHLGKHWSQVLRIELKISIYKHCISNTKDAPIALLKRLQGFQNSRMQNIVPDTILVTGLLELSLNCLDKIFFGKIFLAKREVEKLNLNVL